MNGLQLARQCGVSERQIYHWAKRGWLKPKRVAAPRWGGTEWSFSKEDEVVAYRMGILVRAGMYPDAAVKLARGHKGAFGKLLAALQTCLTDGEITYRLTTAAGSGQTSVGLADEPCG